MTQAPDVADLPHRRSRWPFWGNTVEACLLLLAVGTPLAIGGVHRLTIDVATIVACFAIFALWAHRRPATIQLPWFGLVLLGATGFTALQLVPLPMGLLRVLAPATAEILQVATTRAGGAPGFHAISLDPGATLWETLKIGSCALAFIAAHNHLRVRARRTRLLVALVVSGVVVTLLGFVGAVAAPGKPLLLYSPETIPSAIGLISTSFVNPNHGAAYLTLCALLAAGLATSVRDIQQRVLFTIAAVLLGGAVFMTLSRGGILALAVGLFTLAVLLISRGTPSGRVSWAVILVPGITALIVGLSGWLAFDAIVAEFTHRTPGPHGYLGKLELWWPGLAMISKNLWVGVGRGAFLTTFPRYMDDRLTATTTFTHLENQYLHLPAEWGLIVGGGLIVASAIALVLWVRRSPPSPRTAAITAVLVAIATHNLIDFNLEMLGVALPIAVLAGALSGMCNGRSSRSRKRGRRRSKTPSDADSNRTRPRSRWRAPHFALATSTSLLLVFAIAAGLVETPDADEDLSHIGRLIETRQPIPNVIAAIREAIRRHPADPWVPLAAGRLLAAQNDPKALSWLNQAMFLFPTNPAIHLETARVLRHLGRRNQALLEYRLALAHGAARNPVLREALPLARNWTQILAVLPEVAEVQAAAVDELLRAQRPDLARRVAERARRLWPQDEQVTTARILTLIQDGNNEEAERSARQLALNNADPAAYHLWAQAADGNRPGAAVIVLKQALERFPADLSFHFALANAYLKENKIWQARKCAEKILGQATETAVLAQAHDLMARILIRQSRPHRAQYERQQARRLRQR